MLERRKSVTLGSLAAAGLLTGVLALPSTAQAEEAGPNTGKISFEMGVDFVSQYLFRGIAQENEGFIAQPYAGVSITLVEEAGPFSDVALNIGLWNSFHSERTLGGNWYEADILLGVSATVFENFSLSVDYIFYVYPNGGASTIEELDITLGYDDSGLWKELAGIDFALNPYVLVAFEIDNQGDGGTSEGIYLELGIAPGFTTHFLGDSLPVDVAFPIKVGLSLDDYYEAGGSDDTFGFFSIGVTGSVPLNFIPSDYGTWTATAGVEFLWNGSNAQAIGSGISSTSRDFYIIGKFGIGVEY